jgi:hypothetical protein
MSKTVKIFFGLYVVLVAITTTLALIPTYTRARLRSRRWKGKSLQGIIVDASSWTKVGLQITNGLP